MEYLFLKLLFSNLLETERQIVKFEESKEATSGENFDRIKLFTGMLSILKNQLEQQELTIKRYLQFHAKP